MRLPGELQPQPPVEIDPQRAVNRFTRWMFHARGTEDNTLIFMADSARTYKKIRRSSGQLRA
jgi:hypothetical protein